MASSSTEKHGGRNEVKPSLYLCHNCGILYDQNIRKDCPICKAVSSERIGVMIMSLEDKADLLKIDAKIKELQKKADNL